MNDWRLLRDYVERDSQSAFALLVERYTRLVYWTCLRDIRTPQLAEDATQVVFLLLARKAPKIAKGVPLSGWLFKTARFVSKDTVKQEARRRDREERAAQEMIQTEERSAEWNEIEPLLNDALMSLSNEDREAVLLRYFGALSLREVAAEIAASEDAARKRIARAVDKLRAYLTRRDVAVPVALLTALLVDKSVQAVPPGCQAAMARFIPQAAAGHGAGIVLNSHLSQLHQGVLSTMAKTKTKITIITASAVAGLVLVGTFALMAHANQSKTADAGKTATAKSTTPRLSTVNTATFADNTGEAQKLRLSATAAVSSDPNATAEQEISAILRLIVDETNQRDLSWANQYMSPDFQLIMPNKPVINLTQLTQMSQANLNVLSPYEKTMALQSFAINNGEARVTGSIHETGTITVDSPNVPKGTEIVSDSTFVESWSKQSGQWLAVKTVMLHNSSTINGQPVPGAF